MSSYARQALVRTSSGWTVTNQSVSPISNVQFPVIASGSGNATYWSITTASSGSSQIIAYGPLNPQIPLTNGSIPQINSTSVLTLGGSISSGLLGDTYDAPTYSAGTTYSQGNYVTYSSAVYIFINSSSSSGHTPGNTTYWLPVTLTDQGLGNAAVTSILDLIFNATTWTSMAINATSSPFTNLYLALHTASPGASGTASTNEVSYT